MRLPRVLAERRRFVKIRTPSRKETLMPDKEFDKLSEGIGEIPIPDTSCRCSRSELRSLVSLHHRPPSPFPARSRSTPSTRRSPEQRVIMLTLQKQNDNSETPGAAEAPRDRHARGDHAHVEAPGRTDPPPGAGRLRARINSFLQSEPYFRAKVTRIPSRNRPRSSLPRRKPSSAASSRTWSAASRSARTSHPRSC
mgnify:CR=1 FL=1